MKKNYILISTFLVMVIGSCTSTKNASNNDLYNSLWELEYISGTRIAFNGLYPDRKPVISFNKATGKITGNNSCNGYSADFTIKGDNIDIGEPGPTTMMFCGDGEQQFLKMMKNINTIGMDREGKLYLMIGEIPMMRFKKITQ
ncbi:META domain-containing protein [Arenibacter sp. BSSL-BM3]|uniref:META domain-containing protein n=1 Tax=Arenibacter arenosicollis TaxID=2762274 RepID=A0ABR7QTG0_9FLAO|nr:META domain-containing protein [Arenibacter arenosicollis]MBC8770476.1 META domain-containing protein [Arenibacter arenosicollis]